MNSLIRTMVIAAAIVWGAMVFIAFVIAVIVLSN